MLHTSLPCATLVRSPGLASLRVNGLRMLYELDALSTFGRDSAGGLSRLGFGPADNAARHHLMKVAATAGLASRVDEAGNVFVHRAGLTFPSPQPVLLMGSHLDSVPRGGALDGAYGVIAAFEVLRVLTDNDVALPYEPVVVAFANEEGALFPQPFWGSKAIAGQLVDPDSAADRFGNSIRGPLADAGGDLRGIDCARWRPGSIATYLELHVEQGPTLEAASIPIGVVTDIVGRTIIDIEIQGRQSHAGTTPMDQRADALTAAAKIVLATEDLARRKKLCTVSTVGVLRVSPGQTNVVPGQVSLTAEFRDTDLCRLQQAESALLELIQFLAARSGVSATTQTTMRSSPVHMAGSVQQTIEAAADALSLPCLRLPSGAGHDAQIIAGLAPAGMIFVPSRDGVSHAPEEHTEPHQLVAGADILLQTVLRI